MDPSTVEAIVDAAVGHWPAADDLEITLEANPNSAEAARFHLAEIRDAERAKIELDDMATRRFVESRQHRGIGDRGKAAQGAPAEQAHALVLVGAPRDWGVRSTGVCGG